MSTKKRLPSRSRRGVETARSRSQGTISHDLHALEKLMRKLQREGPEGRELRVCSEARPFGFGVARRLLQLKIDCQVIAPSLIPKKSGDRRKNDRAGGRD